jgi:acyl-homoserine lactone acylase PvdQ
MLHLFRRILLVALTILASHSLCAAQITIYRDSYGIPSIVADRLPDALYGLGYAMAQDNAERMARNYKQARGRSAEVDGKSQLLADGFLRALGIEENAERKAQTLQGEQATLIKSFCAGANQALAEQKGRIPGWIEPFTPVDVLALTQLINAAFPLQDVARQLLPSVGSNQFAIGSARSATGHPILSMDPHLPWDGILAWYEFSLYTKEFPFHGITLPGLPFGVMGHSDKIAWCMTNNDPSLYTFYTVRTNPNNAGQYSYHGEWRDFENVNLEMRYLENGQLKSSRQTTRRTAWGPMVPFRSQAVRLSMLDSWNLDEVLRMARARDAKQFRDALRPLGISMWNIVYADTHGAIGYQFNARVPRRDASFDWSRPVDGADPKTRWGELWALDDLPHVEDPKSNLLVNANSAPWLTPLDDEIKSDAWPAYVTTYGHTTRYDRLAALLASAMHVTTEQAMRIATDTQVPYALKTIRALQQASAKAGASGLEAGLRLLTAWNGRADIDAVGCALYLYWLRADRAIPGLARKAEAEEEWSATERATAVAALKSAMATLTSDHGRLDVPWSEVHLTRHAGQTAATSGFGYVVPGDGAAAVVPNTGRFQNGKIECTVGSSFRMIVSLDSAGIRSWSVLPYGESQDLTSPHAADQMALFGRGDYKDTLFGLKRIRAKAVSRQSLHPVTIGDKPG